MPLKICVLASGSSGNAILVATPATRLLVDAGLPATEITNRLRRVGYDVSDLTAVLLTHAHTDHFRAAGTLSHRHRVPVFARPATVELIQHQCGRKGFRRLRSPADIPGALGDVSVETFPVPHGGEDRYAGDPCGFALANGGAMVTVTTDLGSPSDGLRDAVRRSHAIVIESNYDEETVERKLNDPQFARDWDYLRWVQSDCGHLSNRQCAELLSAEMTAVTTDVFLAHLSENHPRPDRDNNSFELARDTLVAHLAGQGRPRPRIHRTYRRGLSSGQPSSVIEIYG